MKNKKFMKALGVGAVATLGLFTFAGCSLSDTEKADVMKGLKNANTYMEETIDLLRDQNRKLNEQNQELNEQNNQLEDYINEVQKENAKITAEEAFNKLMLAKAKLETNYNGIRDNLSITMTQTNVENTQSYKIEYYQTENNGYVSNFTSTDDDSIFSTFCYENDDKVYEYNKDLDTEGNFIKYTKEIRTDLASSESGSNIEYACNSFFMLNYVNVENINSVEILENGNYKICAVVEFIDEADEGYYNCKDTYLLEYEITADCKFISMGVNVMSYTEEMEDSEKICKIEQISGIATIEYNALTQEYINDLLQEAINKELKAAE